MISKRLNTIAELIPNNSRVIDVGCDHALLDIYLVKNKNCSCLACDINNNALNQAKKNISLNSLTDKVEIKLTDGLNGIKINKDDYIVIAGMGTSTIKHILSNNNLSDNLIISSNNEIEKLRLFVTDLGYKIIDEKFINDKGKYYVIISFKKGKTNYNEIDYDIGPILKNNHEYLEYRINCLKQIKDKIPFYKIFLKININKKIKKLKKIS